MTSKCVLSRRCVQWIRNSIFFSLEDPVNSSRFTSPSSAEILQWKPGLIPVNVSMTSRCLLWPNQALSEMCAVNSKPRIFWTCSWPPSVAQARAVCRWSRIQEWLQCEGRRRVLCWPLSTSVWRISGCLYWLYFLRKKRLTMSKAQIHGK